MSLLDTLYEKFQLYPASFYTTDGGEEGLMALIKARQASRGQQMDGFFSSLEEKYCSKKPKKSTSKKQSASLSSSKDGAGSSKGGKKSKKR